MSTLKPISAPLDRASELRSDEAALDRLLSAAKIIRVSNSQLATDGKSLLFLTAAEVEDALGAAVAGHAGEQVPGVVPPTAGSTVQPSSGFRPTAGQVMSAS